MTIRKGVRRPLVPSAPVFTETDSPELSKQLGRAVKSAKRYWARVQEVEKENGARFQKSDQRLVAKVEATSPWTEREDIIRTWDGQAMAFCLRPMAAVVNGKVALNPLCPVFTKEEEAQISLLGRIMRRLTLIGDRLKSGLRTHTVQSVARNSKVAEQMGLAMVETAKLLGDNAVVVSWMGGKPALMATDPMGVPLGLRSITGPSLHWMACSGTPVLGMSLPVESDVMDFMKTGGYPSTSSFDATKAFEMAGQAEKFGPAYAALVYGGNEVKGSHTRASATVPSVVNLRSLGVEKAVVVDSSDPNTVPEDCISDPDAFFAPYVMAARRSGYIKELVVREDGTVDYKASWAPLKDKPSSIVKKAIGWQGTELEIDGEIMAPPVITKKYGVTTGGLQFRATERLTKSAVQSINYLSLWWRKQVVMGRPQESATASVVRAVDDLCASATAGTFDLVQGGDYKPSTPGIYKGAMFPHAGICKILMDINAAKGRNKAELKKALKEGKRIELDLAFGILRGQEGDGLVSSSWQTTMLCPGGSVEAYVRAKTELVERSIENLFLHGKLDQWLKNVILHGIVSDESIGDLAEADAEEEEEKAVKDVLTMVVKNWDKLTKKTGKNWAQYQVLVNQFAKEFLRVICKTQYGFLPYGQRKESFGMDQPMASLAYAWSAIDLPVTMQVEIINPSGKTEKLLAIPAYHPDPRYWNKLGLLWRYPIAKDTTIMPMVYLQPPEYYRLPDNKLPGQMGIHPQAIKALLFGDTDGDQVCFMRFTIHGDENITFTETSEDVVVTIHRSIVSNDDDLGLLRAFAGVQRCRSWYTIQHDPCKVLDVGPYAKVALNISWTRPLIPWIHGEGSRRLVGVGALATQAARRLENEIRYDRKLVDYGYFEVVEDFEKVIYRLVNKPGEKAVKNAQRSLDSALRAVKRISLEGALQMESAVCGAKYDTTMPHCVALFGMLCADRPAGTTDPRPDLQLLQRFCIGCRENREYRVHNPETDCQRFQNQKCVLYGVWKAAQVAQPEDLQENFSQLVGSTYSVLLTVAAEEITRARRVLFTARVKDAKGEWTDALGQNLVKVVKGEETHPFESHYLGYRPRFEVRMSTKADINNLMAIKGKDDDGIPNLVKVLRNLYREPNFLYDVTTRIVHTAWEGLENVIQLLENLRQDKNTADRKASRVEFSNLLASINEVGKKVKVEDLVTDEQEAAIDRLLVANDWAMKAHLPAIPHWAGEFNWEQRGEKNEKFVALMDSLLASATTYGDLYVPAALLGFGIKRQWPKRPLSMDEMRRHLRLAPPNELVNPGLFDTARMVERLLVEMEASSWEDLPNHLPRPNSPRVCGDYTKKIRLLADSYYQVGRLPLLEAFDQWVIAASKDEVEYMWRVAHTLGLKAEKNQQGGFLGTPTYKSGPYMAMCALSHHMNKFIDKLGVNCRVKNQKELGPIVISVPIEAVPKAGDDLVLMNTVVLSKKNVLKPRLTVTLTSGEEGIVVEQPWGKGPLLRAVVQQQLKLDAVWAEPQSFKILRATRETFKVDVASKKMKKGDLVPDHDGRFWEVVLLVAPKELPPMPDPDPSSGEPVEERLPLPEEMPGFNDELLSFDDADAEYYASYSDEGMALDPIEDTPPLKSSSL